MRVVPGAVAVLKSPDSREQAGACALPRLRLRSFSAVAWLAALLVALALGTAKSWGASPAANPPGGLKVSSNHRYLVDAKSGEPVFILADTAWNLGALSLEEVDVYLESRARHGFNVIMFALSFAPQAEARNAYGNEAYIGADRTELNPAYFQYCDEVVRRCAERHLYVMLYTMWAGTKAGTMNEYTAEQLNRIGKALGARYRGVKNVIFCAGGEATPHYIEVGKVAALGAGLAEGCNAENLVTVHPVSEHVTSEFFADAPWLAFNMAQGKSGSSEKSIAFDAAALVLRGYNATPPKPCMMAEHRYESGTAEDPVIQRRSLYQCVLAGGFGYAYGHNALWQMTPHTAQPWMQRGWTAGVPDWRQALETRAVGQLGHIRTLMMRRSCLGWLPGQALVLEGQGESTATRVQVARDGTDGNNDATCIAAYLSAPADVTIDTRVIAGAFLKVTWFNPETGTLEPSGGDVPNQGRLTLQKRKTGIDAVALIESSGPRDGAGAR